MKENLELKKIKEQRKRIFNKSIFLDLLLLIPPIIIQIGLVLLACTTFTSSLLLTYFVLPMFYTVERRITAKISGIGNSDFSYADGYRCFFRKREGGIFGIILSFIGSLALGILFYFALSTTFPYLCNTFEGAREVYDTIYENLSSNGMVDQKQFIEYLSTNMHLLSRPLAILIGCVCFVPTLYFFFYCVDTNLCDHYLASIVLPDIDLNISASEARGLSRGSFKRYLFKKRFSYAFRLNWIYYLLYALLYAGTLYLFSNIQAINIPSMLLLVIATPSLSICYATILNYFILANEYATLEVIANDLLTTLPEPLKASIYQTYINPNYNHGIESEIRGCFIPSNVNQFTNTTNNYNSNEVETTYESKEERKEENKKSSEPKFGMFDFSSNEETENKNNEDKK